MKPSETRHYVTHGVTACACDHHHTTKTYALNPTSFAWGTSASKEHASFLHFPGYLLCLARFDFKLKYPWLLSLIPTVQWALSPLMLVLTAGKVTFSTLRAAVQDSTQSYFIMELFLKTLIGVKSFILLNLPFLFLSIFVPNFEKMFKFPLRTM